MMGADRATVLDESGQEMTALRLPELLEPDSESATEITYTVTAQAGETAFLEGENDADDRLQRFLSWPGSGRA